MNDLKATLFYTPSEIASLFRREGDLRWVYRHSSGAGFLAAHARRFGRTILFSKSGIDELTGLENKT